MPGYYGSLVDVADGKVLVRFDEQQLSMERLREAFDASPFTLQSMDTPRRVER